MIEPLSGRYKALQPGTAISMGMARLLPLGYLIDRERLEGGTIGSNRIAVKSKTPTWSRAILKVRLGNN